MRKLRIAIGATVHKTVSKDSTGGTEVFAYLLAEGLHKRGHEVTVFAAVGSDVSCKLVAIETEEKMNRVEQGQRLFYGYQLLAAQTVTTMQNEFDIIHCNYFEPFLFTPFSKQITKPIIYTVHADLFDASAWQEVTAETVKASDLFVFVAKHAYDRATLLPSKQYIYNGTDINSFPFSAENEDYLFWLGRIRRKKGIQEAAVVAMKSRKQLIMAGVIDNDSEKEFFDKEIVPFMQKYPNITFAGPAVGAEKVTFYQKAKAFLFPIMWEEPFGLTILEAMSCGTPVIAYARGAVPEILEDGVSGFIVNPSDTDIRGNFIIKKTGRAGLEEAIERLYGLPEQSYKTMRQNARKRVEEHFTIEKMIDNYEKLYMSLAQK